MNLESLLKKVIKEEGSDLHITVGVPPIIRKNGKLIRLGEKILTSVETELIVKGLVSETQMNELSKNGHVDLSFSWDGIGRFRVNVFKQRGALGAAIRPVNLSVATIQELGLPPSVSELARKNKGLILVTGPAGSGKSTTLASIINQINEERDCHILTLEDPVEYLHRHKKSIVNQREIGSDVVSYPKALRAALREDPDVIMIGEMTDADTIFTAITAAETGHLVLSTLHTNGAADAINRIIDIFELHRQHQIRILLSGVLQGIISQQLLRTTQADGRIAAVEVMVATPEIRGLIRESRMDELNLLIQNGDKFGMQSMDSSLLNLYKKELINQDAVLTHASSQENAKKILGYT